MHFRPTSIAALVALFLWVGTLLGQVRESVSLDGTWQSVTTQQAGDVPPADGWREVSTPGTMWNSPEGGTHFIWFKKAIEVPSGDRRVYVDLRGALYTPRVYVDGKLAGAGSDGWSPSLIEITSLVKPGSTHELLVRCQDRGTFFPEGFVLKPGMSQDEQRGKLLGPVGGYKEVTGLWDRAFLRIVPKQHVVREDLAIVPSVRKKTLTLTGRVEAAEAGTRILAAVLDGEKRVLEIPAADVGADGGFELSASFADARFWSPEDPYLYTLQISLQQGETTVDTLSERFGFKEVWTDGPDIYLNGVKRHLLATSTWPVQQYVPADEVRRRIRLIKGSNAIAFRPHTCPWPELWMQIADEEGLLMVGEAAVYTDQFGMYGYTDERFWQNYQKHLEGFIRRDRNRASLVMWSLGNEIAFMGMARYNKDLAKEQGRLARFARSVDPHHPLTFEADLDPDGAYDVIGLHYPHEMPQQRDYPNTTDWLAQRKEATEAAGGMLGQQSARGFLWERKKPLYIGEYLWVPHEDYSVGTIWNGEDAILNRDVYHDKSKYAAWYDQTLGYRRAGVSGICPWTAFDFGAVQNPSAEPYQMQKQFFEPVAAFWRNRGLRFFSGADAQLGLDVFNDSATKRDCRLDVLVDGKVAWTQQLSVMPGEYRLVEFEAKLPETESVKEVQLESRLVEGEKVLHQQVRTARVYPSMKLTAPEGKSLVMYEGETDGMSKIADADPKRTILVVMNGALSPSRRREETKSAANAPVIGGGGFDAAIFRRFLERGGRAIVLEQDDLSPLGLGLAMRDSAATMAFPIDPSHPLLRNLRPEDLSYWGPDNYVARKQIVRPANGGAAGVVVSGGPDWLANSTVVDMPVGAGRAVLIQAMVGEKALRSQLEPAAAVLLQNAIDYLAQSSESSVSTAEVLSATPEFAVRLKELGLATDGGEAAKLLVISGGGAPVVAARDQIERTLASGGTVYWHAPTVDAFASLREVIGAGSLKISEQSAGISLVPQRHPLLRGISREDVLCTSNPRGWDRQISLIPAAARAVLEREGEMDFVPLNFADVGGAARTGGAIRFDRSGAARAKVSVEADGVYVLQMRAAGRGQGNDAPLVMFKSNGVETMWIAIASREAADYRAQLPLRRGENEVAIRFANGARWGGGMVLTVESAAISREPAFVDADVELLTVPAAVATWKVGDGRVVIDCVNWDRPWPGSTDPRRFASALLANIGARFEPPRQVGNRTPIALSSLKLIGESPYLNHSADAIDCYNNATFEIEINCARAGEYRVAVTARGTSADGVYPKLEIVLDGERVAAIDVDSTTDRTFVTPALTIAAGVHRLRIAYGNDAVVNGQDRNLFVRKIEFVQ